jgi:hypothetical protein
MEKPYATLEQTLCAPIDEMPEVIVGALNSCGWGRLQYLENPSRLQAELADQSVWGGRRFSANFAIEVVWRKDNASQKPVGSSAMPTADAVNISVRLRQQNTPDQGQAVRKAKILWDEIKERTGEMLDALPHRRKSDDHGKAHWATRDELAKEGYLGETPDTNPSVTMMFETDPEKSLV